MRLTIAGRLWSTYAVAIAALALVGCLLNWTRVEAERAEWWIEHTETVLFEVTQLLSELKDADTAQRGFIITREERFLAPYRGMSSSAEPRAEHIRELTKDNPLQHARAQRLVTLVSEKMADIRAGIDVKTWEPGRAGDPAPALLDRGKAIMDQIRGLAAEMIATEQALLLERRTTGKQLGDQSLWLLIAGGGLVGLVLLVMTLRTLQRLHRPLRLLTEGTNRIGAGDLDYRIPTGHSRDDLEALGRAFNTMAERLKVESAIRWNSEAALQESNQALHLQTTELQNRSRTIDLLSRMAHRLQSCTELDEFAEVVRRFAPEILPGVPGVLYLMSSSRNLLRTAASWNAPVGGQPEFYPESCWALRRGQSHAVGRGPEVDCKHRVPEAADDGYRCFPMMAQGDTLGMIYVENPRGSQAHIDARQVEILVENIALALGNYRLREALRVQSIRDPLTSLFNRRYLDETLELEFARSRREGRPLAIIMMDVDHFKNFNDTFGHDAGDAVLKSVAHVLGGAVREGDIACRYGGEEFTFVLPGASLEDATRRAEALREATKSVNLVHAGTALGRITCSLGVAIFPAHGATPLDVIRAADEALLRAKTLGRDRVEAAVVPQIAAAA